MEIDRENHSITGKGLEFKRIATGIVKEHRRLFADFPFEADLRRDGKLRARNRQPVRQRLPVAHRQHHTEMRHRHVMAIDRIMVIGRARIGREVCDKLMPEKIEIDPVRGRSPLGTSQQLAVKGARGGEIMDRKGKMEWPRHGATIAGRVAHVTGLVQQAGCA